MSQQKVVSIKIAAILVILVIVLSSVLIFVITAYLQTNAGSQIINPTDSKDNQIAELKSKIVDLNSILNLNETEIVVENYAINQGANSASTVKQQSYPYSGYLIVYGTSTTSNAYVKLEYWFNGTLYSFTQMLGTSGELFFSIPKTDSATVYTGNTNVVDGATETLTVVYHF
jgi:hypothetical protein